MSEDKRRHLRLPVESAVFIELVSPLAGNAQSGQVARCKTLDVSRGGLRVNLSRPLLTGSILQIGVELPGSDDTLYLAGEVRWCNPDPLRPGTWMAGFAVLDAADSDIDLWLNLLAELEH